MAAAWSQPSIDYRHVIDCLVRQPGAFAQSRFRTTSEHEVEIALTPLLEQIETPTRTRMLRVDGAAPVTRSQTHLCDKASIPGVSIAGKRSGPERKLPKKLPAGQLRARPVALGKFQ
jgi:hypothetical protein